MKTRFAISVVVLTITGALAAGCSDAPSESTDSAGRAHGDDPPGMEHVHGLGIDPADGMLYAGTHHGLFRVPEDGPPELVADRVQDFMGFTVAGPGHFLASGHPGPDQDGPAALGLIESTDTGESWESRSLSGEADFHALEFAHDQVYGYNAMTGEFLVSADREQWESRSQLGLADFAVSPDDPDVVLATTQEGLQRSADGGRSFEVVGSAPLLLLVDWNPAGAVVGISPSGDVYTSDDSQSWQQQGKLGGQPEALVADDEVIYAVAGGEVQVSSDGGQTFKPRYDG